MVFKKLFYIIVILFLLGILPFVPFVHGDKNYTESCTVSFDIMVCKYKTNELTMVDFLIRFMMGLAFFLIVFAPIVFYTEYKELSYGYEK